MLSRVAIGCDDEVVRAGRTELEMAADIDWRLKRAGFEKPAFETIVASGPNSALPHARPTDRRTRGRATSSCSTSAGCCEGIASI